MTSPSSDRNRKPRPDLATVESLRNDLVPEEFPEGPYGAPDDSPLESSLRRPEQRPMSAFAYENRHLHAGLERDYPQDHALHDEAGPSSSGGE